MNAPLRPEVLLRPAHEPAGPSQGGIPQCAARRYTSEPASPQQDLPLASEGVLRYVWESRFGAMLIEVRGEDIFVNSQPVERCKPAP